MFSTSEAATAALKMSIPDMRLRPLVHASTKSRKKAKMRVEEFGGMEGDKSFNQNEFLTFLLTLFSAVAVLKLLLLFDVWEIVSSGILP